MRAELENLPQPNWFWYGENVLALLAILHPVLCVEIGTNRGCSAIATARAIRQWGGHLTCVDVWEAGQFGASVTMEECRYSINKAGVGDAVTLLQLQSDAAAALWPAQDIDYLYIDASHTYDAVTQDLELWWPHVKRGGLVAGDDYDDPYDPEANVTRAWNAFEQRHDQHFVRTSTPGLQSRLIWGVKRR